MKEIKTLDGKFLRKVLGEGPLYRPRRIWRDSCKIYLVETRCGNVNLLA
jgi:hypothetical protein